MNLCIVGVCELLYYLVSVGLVLGDVLAKVSDEGFLVVLGLTIGRKFVSCYGHLCGPLGSAEDV